METTLFIEKSKNNPRIDFNKETGTLMILGRSHMNNTTLFYEKIHTWIKEYIKDPPEKTIFVIFQESFNSASEKQIFDIIIELQKIAIPSLKIIWLHDIDDEDSQERGEGIREITEFPHFQVIGVEKDIYNNPTKKVMELLGN